MRKRRKMSWPQRTQRAQSGAEESSRVFVFFAANPRAWKSLEFSDVQPRLPFASFAHFCGQEGDLGSYDSSLFFVALVSWWGRSPKITTKARRAPR